MDASIGDLQSIPGVGVDRFHEMSDEVVSTGTFDCLRGRDGKRQKVETMIDSLVDGLRRTLSNHRARRLGFDVEGRCRNSS